MLTFGPRPPRRAGALAGVCLLLLAVACGESRPGSSASSAAAARALMDSVEHDSLASESTAAADTGVGDTTGLAEGARVHLEDTARVRSAGLEQIGRLSPLADSIADQMTFLATFQRVFIAASRARRLLLDIGRIDARLGKPSRVRAFQDAVRELSPVKVGDRFELNGPWGSDSAVVTGYAPWNGRITATLLVTPHVDTLAHAKGPPLVAVAERIDSAPPPRVDSCARDSVDSAMVARVDTVRDSLSLILQADTAHLPPRLLRTRKVGSSFAIGCFGPARVLLFVNASAGATEYTREFAVLVDTTGRVVPLRVADVRFRVHQALRALDADGDGVDDIAAIGHGERTGGTVVLRLDPVKRRLDYVMSGFAWETY